MRRLTAIWKHALLLGLCVPLAASCNKDSRDASYSDDTDLGVLVDLRTEPRPPDLTPPPDLAAPDVHVVITADNAYAFGWGYADRVTKLSGRPMTVVAGDIFNCPIGVGPEAYDIPAKRLPMTAICTSLRGPMTPQHKE